MGNCLRCGGTFFPDNGTKEASCFNCGYREYGDYQSHPPSLEDRRQAEFDLLPYVEQVRILRKQRKQAGLEGRQARRPPGRG